MKKVTLIDGKTIETNQPIKFFTPDQGKLKGILCLTIFKAKGTAIIAAADVKTID